MSLETGIALLTAVSGLCVSCVTVGIVLGKLKGKMDTLERDVNSAFRMIREIQTKE